MVVLCHGTVAASCDAVQRSVAGTGAKSLKQEEKQLVALGERPVTALPRLS